MLESIVGYIIGRGIPIDIDPDAIPTVDPETHTWPQADECEDFQK